MKLSELIDLEVQLLRDERAEGEGRTEEIRRRDRAIGMQVATGLGVEVQELPARLDRDRALRHRVCRRFLELLPAAERKTLPGHRIEGGYRIVGWVLLALFFCAGIGTASAALHGTAGQPINVLVFIVIFFVLQILLLLLYPVLLLARRVFGGGAMPWLQGLVVRLSTSRLIDRWTGGGIRDLPDTMHQLRMRQAVYGGVQQWLLFSLVQRMAMGFNLAALLTGLCMVSFSDLPFCWATTLEIPEADLHRWLSWIAAPWSFLDSGTPTVEAIRYSRWVTSGTAGYVTVPAGVDPGLVENLRRSWWPFLITGVITWGLLPRALAFAAGRYLSGRASRRVPLNHMPVQHLFERLFPRVSGWTGPDPASVRGAPPVVKPMRKPLATARRDPSAACYLVCWGTLHADAAAVEAHVRNRFHRTVAKTLGAGLADVAVEAATVQELIRGKARRVVVVMPEGQQPTKDVTRFLADLRSRLGADCEIVVGLLAQVDGGFGDVDQDEIESWRARLLAEGDPYLSLQSMEISA